MARIVPVDRGSKEVTFGALKPDFGLNDRVRNIFLAGPTENLEGFHYYFGKETETDALIATEEALTGPVQRQQVARVKGAWTAVKRHGLRKESRNTTLSVAKLDDLLEEVTLEEVKAQSWKRYSTEYPVEVCPSDQTFF